MKQPITRRTLLKGTGVAMGLPWLESMATAAAPPPQRFAVLFMGTGISPGRWWAKGAGAALELSESLAPLEPLKAKLNVIDGLFNKAATGQGIHPAMTGAPTPSTSNQPPLLYAFPQYGLSNPSDPISSTSSASISSASSSLLSWS